MAEIKNDGISLQVRGEGVPDYTFLRSVPRSIKGIPIELNIVNESGKSLISDSYGLEMKLCLSELGGVRFSTSNAFVNSKGRPICEIISKSPVIGVINSEYIRDCNKD